MSWTEASCALPDTKATRVEPGPFALLKNEKSESGQRPSPYATRKHPAMTHRICAGRVVFGREAQYPPSAINALLISPCATPLITACVRELPCGPPL